ncbi:MAG: transcription elongation factor GreA [Bacteriovoracaceae bacterium]|jgi:transcription elongation factor GreA|nr:transcription elongation factor GreA [Bacteriovoracaceae bacterium]
MAHDEMPITKAGKDKIEEELNHLVKVEREKLKETIAEARELGDLKENAEYHAAKERQGIIEGRIAQLQGVLARARVVDVSKIKSERIVFGATVTLRDIEKESVVTYQVVGEDEADIRIGKVSFNSPLGKALIGKEAGDTVIVKAPKGDVEYEIDEFEFV